MKSVLTMNQEGISTNTGILPTFLTSQPSLFSPSNAVEKLLPPNAENCFIVGVEDRTSYDSFDTTKFSMQESMAELADLANAAGLKVVGSTYQRLSIGPSPQYFIGSGKSKEIARAMDDLNCQCVIFDTELTPSQQKNLEKLFNTLPDGRSRREMIKVIDRTALILDIFAQHARSREGQLQVELAMLTYRLPRLTKMWSHLERQTASSKGGKSNGGVGLRGPGEQQLEADRRQMKVKISQLNQEINTVRAHRSLHRNRRRALGVPVVALVGYTNSGKSTLLNAFTQSDVFAADMLFATLDPTTRLVKRNDSKTSELLMTDTVGFIQKLPTHLIAAFRATLEEIVEADILLHVTDISAETWLKQELAVREELQHMGLTEKPLITVWNKVDAVPESLEVIQDYAKKRTNTVAISAKTGYGLDELLAMMEEILSQEMKEVICFLRYDKSAAVVSLIHRLGKVQRETYGDEEIEIHARIPRFLFSQLQDWREDTNGSADGSFEKTGIRIVEVNVEVSSEIPKKSTEVPTLPSAVTSKRQSTNNEETIDWKALAKGRHR